MIIKNITVKRTKISTRISADIKFQSEKNAHYVFFDVDNKFYTMVQSDATPFVAAFLLPAMSKNEDIIVEEATISKHFAVNCTKLMKQIHKWNSDFSIITINSQTKPDTSKGKKRAEFFTAGVDSFYTYLKAKKAKKHITHFLFVHGFDIELENVSYFQKSKREIEAIAKKENVQVVTLRTNIKKISEQYIEWDWGHGGALAAVALLLRKAVSEVYIAGALRKDQLFPYGTHPAIDPLWGTETLQLFHDGNEYDRLDKVMHVVGKSDLALSHLRVCNQNLKGKYNCSRCFKCLWTMMTLECAGTLKKTKTFKHTIDLEAVKNMRYTFERNYHLAGVRVMKELKRQKRREDLQEAIRISLERSIHPNVKQRVAMKIAEIDKKYNKRRIYLTIFAMNKNQDRNKVFKLLARQGIIK